MIPLIPIALAVAGLASGVASGISSVKNAKAEANAVREQALAQIKERQKQAKLLMSEQKNSFLKGGVYFDSGTPEAVIDETFDTMQADVSDMVKDANTKIKNYTRQGKTAFYTSLLNGVISGAMGYASASSMLGSASSGAGLKSIIQNIGSKFSNSQVGTSVKNLGSKIASSQVGTNASNWYNAKRGWNIGGFGTASGGSSTTKIV